MRIDLSGRTAIVTGSTGGIGLAIAKGLAAAGAAVTVNGRSEARVHAAIEAVLQAVPRADVTGVAADLAVAEGTARLLARVQAADILVNNLGIFEPTPFAEITDADWQRFFDTNVMSGVRVTRAYLPGMVAAGWGRVVFISSESGLNIPKEMIHYGMTKTAQLAISRGLAESVAGTGVTVNAVLAGPDLVGGGCGHVGRGRSRGGGSSIRQGLPAHVADRAPRHRRGGGEYGGLCLLASGVGHIGRSFACRWRCGSRHRLAPPPSPNPLASPSPSGRGPG
jgi:NAD(P)-dependent dehydrogenase (short-subunit alcohol dehydrogenase family)